MSYVELSTVSKRYGQTLAVAGVDLAVEQGEFFSLLGPSGCGKTTILRMIAGFVKPSTGQIVIGGQDVTRLPPEQRGIGIVFQNYAIFPHMNAFDNIAFGLRLRKTPRREIERRVGAALAQVGLEGYEGRFQREMSGGEQQRVALARVLVTEPHILLLDEPLSALDKKLREEMKYWIKDLQQQLGITTLYVTHDQSEALTMSSRIAVMSKGHLQQIGTPIEIYEHPVNRFVTDFIGESNIMATRVIDVDGDMAVLTLEGFEIIAPKRDGIRPQQEVSLAVRPEHIFLGTEAERDGCNCLSGTLRDETYQGALIRYVIEIGRTSLVVEAQNRPDRPIFAPGVQVSVGWEPAASAVLID